MEKQNDTIKKSSKKQQLTLLKAVETIVEEAQDSQLSETFIKKCKKEIQLIANAYCITEQQAVLFCIIIECGPHNVNNYELPRFLDMRNVKSLSFGADIKAMVKMRLLRFRNKDQDSFGVPDQVLNALKENQAVTKPTIIVEDCETLFDIMATWFDLLDGEYITAEDMTEDLHQLFKDNSSIDFARQMLELNLTDIDMLLLAFFCNQLVNEDDSRILPRQFDSLFESKSRFKRNVSMLFDGRHNLAQKGLIEPSFEDGQASSSTLSLTDKAKRTLLDGLDVETAESDIKMNNVCHPEDIRPKTLFYPKSMMQQIKELNGFLDEDKFQRIQQRMAKSNFRTGFACLFYGAPGTGKTETAYQLARATGRSIMLVDVPSIKSKWVGESEKNIKAIFDRYRQLVRRSEVAPILLFNEADAIFGIRLTNIERSVDKMENSIQNIILQEMEGLHGILIATTNLVTNLDAAFERRFLYKVKFETPDAAVRCRIWQAMIPGLDENIAKTLANTYELSGGQIENVARKNSINSILHEEEDTTDLLATLEEYCKTETLQANDKPRRMGF